MAKPVKNEYEVLRRYHAFIRLQEMKNVYSDIPPVEIYGIQTKKTGVFTLQDIINCL